MPTVRRSLVKGTVSKWGPAGDFDRTADCKRETIREFHQVG